ncbi:helix-turn-helix transcriptional regulator [Streptomyces sp. NPDC047315]|uniref:helix-turn-helix transcriptional regulator n=1 Tax=Streptomyces sp. NPDC047315 TaxID=3155142 RepID=UPI0033F47541
MDDPIRHPLAHARTARGWSQPELAREVRRAALRRGLRSGVERQRIWKWENYRAVPDADSQALLAEVFEIDRGLVESFDWPHWLPGRDDPLPLGPHSPVPALREALRAAMDRRAFLTYSTTGLTGLAQQWAGSEPHAAAIPALEGKTVGAELVGLLEATGEHLTELVTEQRQHTRALLDAHLTTVTDLIEHGRYGRTAGRRLHALAARLSQTVGWHRFDQDRHAAASRFWHGALHSAYASGDRDLGAGVLSDLAYQATWLKDPATAVDILQSAVPRARHPAARALLHLRLARALAALREPRGCHRALAAAERELGTAALEPAPAWCAWMSPADLLVDSGQCLMDLGRGQEARRLIREGMTLLPAARSKTRAVFLTSEARSLLHTGEVEHAARAAKESLALAERIGAPRCGALVRDLLPGFAPHRDAEGVPELLRLAHAH